ncbi:hypothetical protein TNCV_1292181 [Trichonephila clavipes]|nr:hypothetical protein TNCV_1292181 [Trichonephila clavipes]
MTINLNSKHAQLFGHKYAVWSRDNTTALRAYGPPPLKRLATVFRDMICHLLNFVVRLFLFADRTIYLSSAGVVLLTLPVPRAIYYTFQ